MWSSGYDCVFYFRGLCDKRTSKNVQGNIQKHIMNCFRLGYRE